jgi:GAF domain
MKFKFNFNLANQILAGYSIIILVAVVASVFCIISLRGNQEIDKQINQVNLPFYLNLKELNTLASEMNKLTNNWIYRPTPEDKKTLQGLLEETYPKLSAKMASILQSSEDSSADSVRASIASLKQITDSELQVTKLLDADSLYSNDVVVDQAIQLLDKTIAPRTKQLGNILTGIINLQERTIAEAQIEKEKSYSTLTLLLVFMILAFIATTVAAYLNVRKRIVAPIVTIKDSLVKLGSGKIEEMSEQNRSDELGLMHNAMVNLTKGMNEKSVFASHIGNGKYDEQFNLLSEEDSMGKALLTMRENLKANAEEDRKRNWAVTGLAKFGELLRNQDQDLEKFGDQVLSFTIKYSSSNQGRLYVVNDDVKDHKYLQLIACYAWEKKKFVEDKIEMGQGLTGQCWQEGDPIYMTKVPDDYVKITSGLGLANPSNIFIVPLKVNEVIYGVIEMASFKVYQDFEREFILKLSENLAAAISTVRINQKTKTLLAQTQQQAEEMRSQEEEMRQNMEELSATQEEMSRKEKGYLQRIEELERMNHA